MQMCKRANKQKRIWVQEKCETRKYADDCIEQQAESIYVWWNGCGSDLLAIHFLDSIRDATTKS